MADRRDRLILFFAFTGVMLPLVTLASCNRHSHAVSTALDAPGCVAPPRNTPGIPSSSRLAGSADDSPKSHANFGYRTLVIVLTPGTDRYYIPGRVWIFGTLAIFGVRLRALGVEHVDPDRDYVLLSNHRSQLDPPAIAAALSPREMRWVAKNELRAVPPLGGPGAVTDLDADDRGPLMERVPDEIARMLEELEGASEGESNA